ncbi:MAG: hypothetical protein J5I65_10990 [Aridibacter famidurans]|nr:hypothetical protein [Aridibacter famidurans]
MIKLEARNLHWLEPDPEFDTCVHGSVFLEIDGRLIADSVKRTDSDNWTPSGSAIQFLRALEQDHPTGEADYAQLIPCCAMPDLDNDDQLWLTSCSYGIDWQIKRSRSEFVHLFSDGTSIVTPAEEWTRAVLDLASAVLEFIDSSPERQYEPKDLPYEEIAFENYCTELRSLIKKHEQST